MSSSDIAVSVRGLSKAYTIAHQSADAPNTMTEAVLQRIMHPFRTTPKETFWALRDVEFDIKAGEVTGIVGRNGAGKSTLLKVLSRITEPTTGTVDLWGRVGSLLEVGTGFHGELTGRENIFLNGAILGMNKAEIRRQFEAIVDFAGVEQFLDTPVKRYSSGMYVRLAFAVAAHLRSEILIIDEVLAVGDQEFQKKCLGKMHDVASDGRTVLFVSHHMSTVESLCSSVIVLQKGRVSNHTGDVKAGILTYMNGPEATAVEWVNDGRFDNAFFKPKRIYLTDEAGRMLPGTQQNDADVWVNFDLEVKDPDPGLTIGYSLVDPGGAQLYWTVQNDTAPEHWPTLKPGQTTLRTRMPKRLLNHGIYRIEMIAGIANRQWLMEPGDRAPHVTLEIAGKLSDSPQYVQARSTVLAPVYPWSAIAS